MLVYAMGMALGTEAWSKERMLNLIVVVGGVLIATYGEVAFVMTGVVCQVISLFSEALRLTLVQRLVQNDDIKLNPIATMYYVSPICFIALLIPLATMEAGRLMMHDWSRTPASLVIASAVGAFALNCSVYLLVGRSSALTMNVAGVIKDILLVCLSVFGLSSIVTSTQIGGYGIALLGVFYYNYRRLQAPSKQTVENGEEGQPILSHEMAQNVAKA